MSTPPLQSKSQDESQIESKAESKAESNPYLPLMIDFTDKIVVIFGGGAVGERKVKRFAEKALVTVVSSSLTPDLQEMEKDDSILFIEKDLSKLTDGEIFDCMSDAFLVIAATSDSEVNRRIVSMAKTAGVLVNDTEKADEVIIPSLIERGGLQIAISSGGDSPAVTKYARMKIVGAIDNNFEQMILLQNEMREYLKTIISDQKKRQKILWEIMNDEEIWDLLSTDFEKAREKAMKLSSDF
ncbi:Siroheme synthase [Methanimicrococcus hongohii]|uniref:precorrin-2 dehydrogenase n=1 Tax=Methanimicrococcus hongohii TaxID=3028295 RepID=A0AA96V2R3_9EURY|nr:bifunctional precorrin-2 dehydrogenase/sirohydrochlorin ferrochelatase [Methanimicrococcus sp. Hf6]WNY24270.1 Siroheme synthase [Methanimicrococcus sp. Hf6]